ncbi:MAG TPA: hypothetical protein IAA98_09555 [Candidatus Avipropionibacterium avicola]|uniref:Uncharacterized protein n=1 Tax=Candidatus Avipropionibacterium avicola TaxID=2840701 RepID=A0A9D1GYH5_9ACTN|nr:hypothetical protein [Candidatus Avipropionibacterium avicola]
MKLTVKARVSVLAGALAAASLIAAPAAVSQAALTTTCVGEAGAVTVPGDLVVPKDKSCVLDGTTVEGKVTVRSGADLVVTGGSFADVVVIQENGYLDMTDTTVEGRVTSRGGFGVYTSGSSVGSFVETGAGDGTPFLYAEGLTANGAVKVTNGEAYLKDSTLKGVTAENPLYADVVNSTLAGALTVTGARSGSQVCASEVDGVATFSGNAGVQLGSGTLFGTCDGGSNYFGKDVAIDDNTEGVQLNGNIIRGSLTGEGNDPAPVGDDNRVRGAQEGQFADLQPGASTMSRKAAPAPKADLDKAADRKADALTAAAKSGKAQL